jgi:DnaD/phage-associated family protein
MTAARPPGEAVVDGHPFTGFPPAGTPTLVPSLFFSRVLPEITEPAELVVTLYVTYAASFTKRQPRFVTGRELAADTTLIRSLANIAGSGRDHEALARGLDLAVERRTILRARVDGDDIYTLNIPANARALARLGNVRIEEPLPPAMDEAVPDIFTLYEENIGNITPLIAEDLKDAETRYPREWIVRAFREAAELNKRNWRYIERILKRWETEGPSYEEPERDPQREWLARRYRTGRPKRRA